MITNGSNMFRRVLAAQHERLQDIQLGIKHQSRFGGTTVTDGTLGLGSVRAR